MTLIPVGPLTNVARLLEERPDEARRIGRVVLIGGAIAEGNVTPAAEFNIWADPEAAARVFGSGLDVTMVGLDVTHQALVGPDHAERLRASGRVGEVVAELLHFYGRFHRKIYDFAGSPIHDAVAVAHVIRPKLLETAWRNVEIEVRVRTLPGAYGGRPLASHRPGAERTRGGRNQRRRIQRSSCSSASLGWAKPTPSPPKTWGHPAPPPAIDPTSEERPNGAPNVPRSAPKASATRRGQERRSAPRIHPHGRQAKGRHEGATQEPCPRAHEEAPAAREQGSRAPRGLVGLGLVAVGLFLRLSSPSAGTAALSERGRRRLDGVIGTPASAPRRAPVVGGLMVGARRSSTSGRFARVPLLTVGLVVVLGEERGGAMGGCSSRSSSGTRSGRPARSSSARSCSAGILLVTGASSALFRAALRTPPGPRTPAAETAPPRPAAATPEP